MSKKEKITVAISVLICLLPIVLGVAVYDKLPERIPIHFTVGDQPDRFGPKEIVVFGIPVFMAILQAVVMFSYYIKSGGKSENKPKIFSVIQWMIPIITAICYILSIFYALGIKTCIGKCVCLMVGVMFILLGNYMPKMNYETAKSFFHPTPKDEKSFYRTSRIIGYIVMGIGLMFIVAIFFV